MARRLSDAREDVGLPCLELCTSSSASVRTSAYPPARPLRGLAVALVTGVPGVILIVLGAVVHEMSAENHADVTPGLDSRQPLANVSPRTPEMGCVRM